MKRIHGTYVRDWTTNASFFLFFDRVMAKWRCSSSKINILSLHHNNSILVPRPDQLVLSRMKRLTFSASRIFLSLFAIQSSDETSATTIRAYSTAAKNIDACCRSNATHIVWKHDPSNNNIDDADINGCGSCCAIQTRKEAEKDCLSFLKNNIMDFDLPFKETMGFPDEDDTTADGLDYGMIQPTIRLALDAKVQYPWTDELPKDIFMDYVLNYANLNEARTNWRPLLVDTMQFNTTELYKSGEANISSVTTWVNTHLWTKLAKDPNHPIYFKSSQTPLIFDPMSIIAFGYASCTGTSILFCNALRAVGIPARVAGTPSWYGNRTQGNHNWVEVYVGSQNEEEEDPWKFLEPSPALPHVDTIDADPCSRWFCESSRYPSSKVYAAKMSKDRDGLIFPLAWEWNSKDIPAEDRTDYYTRICDACRKDEDDGNTDNDEQQIV